MAIKAIKLAASNSDSPFKIIPPPITDIETKDRWLKEVQMTSESDWKPVTIKVTYEIYNPEIENLRRFFHVCVEWYAIQNGDMVDELPKSAVLKQYREEILDELLGYDKMLVTRTVRQRKSTTDFKTVQAWNKFIKLLEETLFEQAGYEFPESEEFWKLVKVHGYTEARKISLQQLQNIIKNR